MAPGLHAQNKASQNTAAESVPSQLKSRPFASGSDREQQTADSTAQIKGASRLSHNFSNLSVLPPTSSVNGTQPIQLAYDPQALQNELRDPNNNNLNGPLDFGFKEQDWHKKATLEGQLASDVRGMYGTMFGNPDNNHAQNEQEKEQRKILNRAHVAMAYGNTQYRDNETSKNDSWKPYDLPMASLLAHGGRTQIHFAPSIQKELGPHAGWNWMATGTTPDANSKALNQKRQYNPGAGLAKRTSSHNAARESDGQAHERSGVMYALTSHTAGMDITPAGVGTPISAQFGNKNSTANITGNTEIGHGGTFPVDPKQKTDFLDGKGAAPIKMAMGIPHVVAKEVFRKEGIPGTRNLGGQHGHFLMAGKNLKQNDGSKLSTLQLGIEPSAPEKQSISGELHDAKALSAPDSVFGQNKFKNMINPTDKGGLNLDKQAVPLGPDSLKSEINDFKHFKRIDKRSKYIEGLPEEQQRAMYQTTLLSSPEEARKHIETQYKAAKLAARTPLRPRAGGQGEATLPQPLPPPPPPLRPRAGGQGEATLPQPLPQPLPPPPPPPPPAQPLPAPVDQRRFFLGSNRNVE